jgi:hypothetical protein
VGEAGAPTHVPSARPSPPSGASSKEKSPENLPISAGWSTRADERKAAAVPLPIKNFTVERAQANYLK